MNDVTASEYAFEIEDKRLFDIRKESEVDDLAELLRRLELSVDDAQIYTPVVKRLMEEFVRVITRNSLWYVRRRKRETRLYRWYMTLTLLLVVLIPLVTAFLPTLLQSGTGSGGISPSVVLSAQLTAIISGIYGVHRLFSSWLFRRNSAHAFWKAGAELKELIYVIEERWRGKVALADAVDPNFLRDLRDSKIAARQIVREERDSFFSAFKNVSTDLQDIVSKSTTAASAIVDKIAGPMLKKVEERTREQAEKEAAIESARGAVVNLISQRRQLTEKIARGNADINLETDTNRKQHISAQVKADQMALAGVNTQIVAAKATFEEKWTLFTQDV